MSRETKTFSVHDVPLKCSTRLPAVLSGHHPSRLSRREAAQFLTDAGLPIAATTLAKKAVQGNGPPFEIWNGKAIYDVVDLLAWAEAQLGPKLRSTAEREEVSR
jgi:hypothetical protein